MKVYLLEVDDNDHTFILGVFSSEQKAKDFLKENDIPVDEDSKLYYNDHQTFYSTTKHEVMITELTIDKVHPQVSLLKKKKMI